MNSWINIYNLRQAGKSSQGSSTMVVPAGNLESGCGTSCGSLPLQRSIFPSALKQKRVLVLVPDPQVTEQGYHDCQAEKNAIINSKEQTYLL